jgi:hypothetical protein
MTKGKATNVKPSMVNFLIDNTPIAKRYECDGVDLLFGDDTVTKHPNLFITSIRQTTPF